MPRKMTHAQARRQLHDLAMHKMMTWASFVTEASRAAHTADEISYARVVDCFTDYARAVVEYDWRFKELTS